MLITGKEKKALKELVGGLRKLYGNNLSRVILYGSKARGDATKDSDMDIMAVLQRDNCNPAKKAVGDLVWRVCYGYDLLITVLIKSESEYAKLDTPLLLNVQREGVTL